MTTVLSIVTFDHILVFHVTQVSPTCCVNKVSSCRFIDMMSSLSCARDSFSLRSFSAREIDASISDNLQQDQLLSHWPWLKGGQLLCPELVEQ